jgi:N-acetyl sugar amidotransferase
LIEKYRNKDMTNYDCIVPVSGGKDSTYQAYVVKEVYGLNPLCVNFEPTYSTELGRKNLDNLSKMGLDVLQIRKDDVTYRKMVIESFKRVGDNEWPNHVGIFTVPVNCAVKFRVPLIVWGENSQLEYGGPASSTQRHYLDRRWLEEFGGLLGNRVEDMVGVDGIRKENLLPYQYPKDEDIHDVGVTGLFLGYYFPWDARKQLAIVREKYNFSIKEDGPIEGTYTNYENLDERTVSIHDYLKYVKFGFGRTTDHACLDVRNGRVDRAEAVRLVNMYDGKYPYYGVKSFMEYTGMSKDEIDRVFDAFTNKQIFECNEDGKLKKGINGDLVRKYPIN